MTTTATTRSVSCPQCATTYRLPASFKKSEAPCKKCGATIHLTAAAPSAAPARTPSAAAEAVRARSTRAQRALGVRTKAKVSPLHVATGIVTLAAVVVAVVIGLT